MVAPQVHRHVVPPDSDSGMIGGFRNLLQERFRQSGENACTIASIGFAAASATVIHVAQDLIGIQDDLMTRLPLDVSHEANPATVLLVGGIVEALFLRKRMLVLS